MGDNDSIIIKHDQEGDNEGRKGKAEGDRERFFIRTVVETLIAPFS